MPGAPARTLDDAVRAVTAFQSFEDLKATERTYAPTFYQRRDGGAQELKDMQRVCSAFNAWAAREGRNRLAEVRA